MLSKLGGAVLVASMAFAHVGDPVPDVDVILEQIPGGVIVAATGVEMDEIAIRIPLEHLGAVQRSNLPRGWSIRGITRDGLVTLTGPKTASLRLRLRLKDNPQPFRTEILIRPTVAHLPVLPVEGGQEFCGASEAITSVASLH